MLFERLWAVVKEFERADRLTVEQALECATRLPEALFCSMMEGVADGGGDPEAVLTQVARLHAHMMDRLKKAAAHLRPGPATAVPPTTCRSALH